MSTPSEKSILIKLECGCPHMIPTNRRRLSMVEARLIFSETQMDGVYCFKHKRTVKPKQLIKISG